MKTLHARLIKFGLDTHPAFATQIANAYGSAALSDAQKLFDQCPHKDIILWNSLISAYSRSRHPEQALHLFALLHSQSFPRPNHYAFATAARACAAASSLTYGQSLHACVVKHAFLSNVVVNTALLDMYAKCYAIDLSCKMFNEMPQRNRISWNALVSGHVLNGMPIQALKLFHRMVCVEYVVPDEFSLATVLVACGATNDLSSGKQIHTYIVRSGFGRDLETAYAVCSMYFRCGDVPSAESMLRRKADSLAWKLIMIRGYYLNGRYFDVFMSIGHNLMDALTMDRSLVFSVLHACANLSLLKIGRQVHGIIITSNNYHDYPLDDSVVLGSALIDMYCNCGSIVDAQRYFHSLLLPHVSHYNSLMMGYIHNNLIERATSLFDKMPERNVISWTSMISGYVQSGLPREGLSMLAKMYRQVELVRGNCFTFSTALDACGLLTALDEGKQIHAQFVRTVLQDNNGYVVVETTLVDMYSKVGNLDYARRVFGQMRKRNVLSWTSMIMGYAIHGYGSQALGCFERMVKAGEEPNDVTFVAVLSACSRCGLVEEGLSYFKLMKEKYGIVPKHDHYTCVVDLLGRAGQLVDAYRFVEKIRHDVNDDVGQAMGALLSGCQLHGNVDMGAMLAKKMLERKQQVSGAYVALSNVYASVGMWEQVYGIRQELRHHGGIKEPGHSVVSVRA